MTRRLSIRCLVAIACVIGLIQTVGCGGGAYSSPQATFETAKAAAKKKDWNGFFNCVTPDSRDQMAGTLVASRAMMKMMSAMPALGGADKAEEVKTTLEKIDAVFEKHGVSEDALKDSGLSAMTKPSAAEIGKLADGIADKNEFIGDMIEAMESMNDQKGENPFAAIADATLEDVKIDGDSATATIVTNEKPKDFKFKRIAGEWKINFEMASMSR